MFFMSLYVAGAVKTNYAAMSWLLRSCQQTVFLEIIHAATGLTKTSTLATVLQVCVLCYHLFKCQIGILLV